MARLLVGLTGGLAAGKSTVARLLKDAGFTVVDADLLVRELYQPGRPGAAALAELLGPGVLDASGAVDRPAVAAKIFHDADARRLVERAVHPLVLERLRQIARDTDGVLVYESAVLAESGHAGACDLVVTVEAPAETRLRRAVGRGMDENDARARLAAQGDGAARRAAADVVIDNSGTAEELSSRVEDLVADLRQRL